MTEPVQIKAFFDKSVWKLFRESGFVMQFVVARAQSSSIHTLQTSYTRLREFYTHTERLLSPSQQTMHPEFKSLHIMGVWN